MTTTSNLYGVTFPSVPGRNEPQLAVNPSGTPALFRSLDRAYEFRDELAKRVGVACEMNVVAVEVELRWGV